MSTSGQSLSDIRQHSLVGNSGLIFCLREFAAGPGEPRLFNVGTTRASLERILGTEIPGTEGAVGFSYEEAAAGAVGETIERYCAGFYEWDDLIFGTQDELGAEAVGMDQFAWYTDEVYERSGLTRWRSDLPVYWVEGVSIASGARRFVPAALVYTPYRRDDPREAPLLAVSVSTGRACHTDRVQALLSGLYEAIERDAFMITWMRRIQPRRVDYRSDPFLDELYRRYFESGSMRLDVFDITLDIRVPTMLCVANGHSSRGRFLNVGAATRHSEREAVSKAMKEACQGAMWVWELMQSRADWRPSPDFSNVNSFEDHVRLYCEPEMVPQMDFITETPFVRPVIGAEPRPELPDVLLQKALQEIRHAELEAIAVDLTTPEIRELGFHAPKVLVPGLAPLTARHSLPALATPRYKDVPLRLGLTDCIHQGWNPAPHPFP
jgi:ribosomal protein S12 methylthiotransferase accessory factor